MRIICSAPSRFTGFQSGHLRADVLTTPRNSWPVRRPSLEAGIDRYGHRSLPQTQERTTRTTASVGV
jgi:hypothetical protein